MLTDDMLIVGGSFEREDGVVCVAGCCSLFGDAVFEGLRFVVFEVEIG